MQYQDAIEKSAADNFKYRSWFLPFFSNPDYFFISSYFLPSKNIWHYPDSLSIIRILSWLFWLCLNKPQTAGIESLTSWLGFSGFGHYCKTSSKEISPWFNLPPSYFPWQHCSRGLPDNFTLLFAQQNWKNWMASNAVFQEKEKCAYLPVSCFSRIIMVFILKRQNPSTSTIQAMTSLTIRTKMSWAGKDLNIVE